MKTLFVYAFFIFLMFSLFFVDNVQGGWRLPYPCGTYALVNPTPCISDAGCPTDQYYCDGNQRWIHDFYCDIICRDKCSLIETCDYCVDAKCYYPCGKVCANDLPALLRLSYSWPCSELYRAYCDKYCADAACTSNCICKLGTLSCCPEGQGCQDGSCVPCTGPDVCPAPPPCKESDGGKVYGTAGDCSDADGKAGDDVCVLSPSDATPIGVSEYLKEFYCEDTYAGTRCKSEIIQCQSKIAGTRCENGRCFPTAACGAADGFCPTGCYNPPDTDCPPPPVCFDTDPLDGKDYYRTGTCDDASPFTYTDTCVDSARNPVAESNTLKEYFCSSPSGSCTFEYYTCPYGCYNGRCKNPPGSACGWTMCLDSGACFGKMVGPNCFCKTCSSTTPQTGCPGADECIPFIWECCYTGSWISCVGCNNDKNEEVCCKVSGGCCPTNTFCYNQERCIKCEDAVDEKINSNPRYCARCKHCEDGFLNCGENPTNLMCGAEKCKDCGGGCVRGTETTADPIFLYPIESLFSGGYYQLTDSKLVFDQSYFCMDNKDNDKDCLIDCQDPDCSSLPICLEPLISIIPEEVFAAPEQIVDFQVIITNKLFELHDITINKPDLYNYSNMQKMSAWDSLIISYKDTMGNNVIGKKNSFAALETKNYALKIRTPNIKAGERVLVNVSATGSTASSVAIIEVPTSFEAIGINLSFAGALYYSNGTAASDASFKATVYNETRKESYYNINNTEADGKFYILITDINPVFPEYGFVVKFEILEPLEAIYECRYDPKTEWCL